MSLSIPSRPTSCVRSLEALPTQPFLAELFLLRFLRCDEVLELLLLTLELSERQLRRRRSRLHLRKLLLTLLHEPIAEDASDRTCSKADSKICFLEHGTSSLLTSLSEIEMICIIISPTFLTIRCFIVNDNLSYLFRLIYSNKTDGSRLLSQETDAIRMGSETPLCAVLCSYDLFLHAAENPRRHGTCRSDFPQLTSP